MIRYAELESECLQNGLNFTAAEVHGILTGILCVTGATDLQTWTNLIQLNRPVVAGDNTPWSLLYQTTLSRLADGEFEFQLLLPDDDTPLTQRTEALADWCRGFLYGVSNGNLQRQMEQSDNIMEIIEDFTQISRAGHDMDEDDDTDESAYMELSEYARAGAMLVYAELQSPMASAADQTTLH